MPRHLPSVILLLAALLAAAAGCRARPVADVVVGVGATAEQRVLVALSVIALGEAGMTVEVQQVAGGTVGLRREAARGNIGLFWDYTGAAWALGMDQHSPPADPHESYARVRAADETNGLIWLEPTTANATLALFVRGEGEMQMSEVARDLSAGNLLCADSDFIERPGGLETLVLAYDIGEGLVVEAAAEDAAIDGVVAGRCFAGLATATSGHAWQAGLVAVMDDLRLFPAFIAAPVVRDDLLGELPDVEPAMRALSCRLDTRSLALLNAAVERGEDPEAVAARFLREADPCADTPGLT